MAKARDIMTEGADCIGANDTISEAARKMRNLKVGALPICGGDNRIKGVLTDRDIVIKVIAEGKDPKMTLAGELGKSHTVLIGADDSIEQALETMIEHKVRRLPVIDGHTLVGMLSQADIALNIPNNEAGRLLQAISASP